MTKEKKIDKSRRRFMILTGLGGGALALGFYLGLGGERTKSEKEVWGDSQGFIPNAWLRVDPEGTVTVRIKHCEMGQGTATGLSALVAEELEMPWNRVRFEIAPAASVYKNPAFGVQATGGSTATPYSWEPLRLAGAAAREMLISAAAATWGVERSQCRAQAGQVIHSATARALGYGELTAKAAKMKPPHNPPLKKPNLYKIIGRSLPRLDTADKIKGRAVFGQDVNLPGMLTAFIIHPETIGAELAGYRAEEALKMPGVKGVVSIESGLAVVAEGYWPAAQAADKVEAQWTGGLKAFSSDGLWEEWVKAARGEEAKELHKQGDPEAAFSEADKVIEAEYRVPWQAHATPEPMNCTAWVEPGRCRIWAPTQNQGGSREIGAYLSGLGYHQVEVQTTYVGGGFGRRGVVDYVAQAVELSKKLGRPVKVMWSREEDMANDFFRPASLHLLKAGLDGQGRILAWRHRIVGPDQMAWLIPAYLPSLVPNWVPRGVRNLAGWAAKEFMPGIMAGQGVKEGAGPLEYQVPNVLVDYINSDPGVPVGFWRGVSVTVNAFPVECFLDELAEAAGKDPVAMRLEMLKGNPRLAKVIEMVGEGVATGGSSAQGLHTGIGAAVFHGAPAAMRAEVSVEKGWIKVHRVVAAVDCGRVINPRIVRDQVAGGIAFGLSAALKSEVTFENGRAVQSNFDDFPILTMEEMPKVEVRLVKSDQPPLGIGELGVPPIAPAVANAVSRAVGRRVRRLPISL